MSSSGFDRRLNLELGPSPTLRRLILAAHAAALLTLGWMPLPGDLRLLLAAALILSLRGALPTAGAAGTWRWERDGNWRLPGGRRARLHRGTFVSPFLVVLTLTPLSGRRPVTCVVFPDRLERRRFRHLRTRLRLDGPYLLGTSDVAP